MFLLFSLPFYLVLYFSVPCNRFSVCIHISSKDFPFSLSLLCLYKLLYHLFLNSFVTFYNLVSRHFERLGLCSVYLWLPVFLWGVMQYVLEEFLFLFLELSWGCVMVVFVLPFLNILWGILFGTFDLKSLSLSHWGLTGSTEGRRNKLVSNRTVRQSTDTGSLVWTGLSSCHTERGRHGDVQTWNNGNKLFLGN